MKVFRTFHPVGQGAFYSERFYDKSKNSAVYNMVFDCGAARGYESKAEHIVSQSFTKNDVIDYLFISHLDYDHVSLVKTLLSSVKRVDNIILPFMTEEDMVIELAYHRLSGDNYMTWFIRRIVNHMNGNWDGDFSNGDYNVHFVGDHDETDKTDKTDKTTNSKTWRSGDDSSGNRIQGWVFIPYNVNYRSRKLDLINKLQDLFVIKGFVNGLTKICGDNVKTGSDLYEKLKEDSFVGKIIENTTLRRYIKQAYEKVEGGINENSLLLYSGPSSNNVDHWWYEEGCLMNDNFNYYRCRYRCLRVACLYTGDSNCDLTDWKNSKYNSVWENIGTIQLPHHGSVESFDVDKNTIERSYVFPVSCGSTNSYGHPSGRVLAYLMTHGCIVRIITELVGTTYIQVIKG